MKFAGVGAEGQQVHVDTRTGVHARAQPRMRTRTCTCTRTRTHVGMRQIQIPVKHGGATVTFTAVVRSAHCVRTVCVRA